MRIGFVYLIMSIVRPDRCYVGSSVDLRDRWSGHRRKLALQQHHSVKLQRHFNKHGLDDLIFIVIEKIDVFNLNDLIRVEQFYIDLLKPYFNMSPTAGSNKNLELTQEQRDKMNKKPVSLETREKQRQAKLGKKRGSPSEETRRKMRESNLGRKVSPETILKLSESHKGKKPTKEQIEKNRLSNTGKKQKIESVAKTLLTKEGIEHTDENINIMILRILEKRESKKNKRSAEEINKRKSEILKKYFIEHPEARDHLSKIQKGRKMSDKAIENMKIGQKTRRDKERLNRENGVI